MCYRRGNSSPTSPFVEKHVTQGPKRRGVLRAGSDTLLAKGRRLRQRNVGPAESGLEFADDNPLYAKLRKHPEWNGLRKFDEGHTIARSSPANL